MYCTQRTVKYIARGMQCRVDCKGEVTTQVRTEAAHPSPLGIVLTLVVNSIWTTELTKYVPSAKSAQSVSTNTVHTTFAL